MNPIVFLATGFSLPAMAMEPWPGLPRPATTPQAPAAFGKVQARFGQTFKQKLEGKKTDSRSTPSWRVSPKHLFTESQNSFTRSQSTAGIQKQESKSGSSAVESQVSKSKPYPTKWSLKVTTVDQMWPIEAAKLIADMADDFQHNPNRVHLKDVEGWMAGATKISDSFNNIDLNQSLGGLAKFKKKRGFKLSGFELSKDFKKAWLDQARKILNQFEARQLANSIHSMATLKWDAGDAFRIAFLNQAVERLGKFNSQELSNSLWSLAKLGWDPGTDFKDAFLTAANKRLGEFEGQHLSKSLWSLAKMGWDPGTVFKDAFLTAAKKRLGEFNSQELSKSLWSLAKLGWDPGTVFKDAFLTAANRRLGEFNSQDFSNTLWGMAKLRWEQGAQFKGKFLAAANEGLGQFKSQELSNTLWAMTKLGWDPGTKFRDKFLTEAHKRLGEFNSQELSNTLWSLATLGWDPGAEFKDKFLAVANERLGEFNSQGLSNTAWGLAILSSLQKDSKESLDGIHIFLNQLKEKREDQKLELSQLHQLYLANQWARRLEGWEGSLEDEDSTRQDEIRKLREQKSKRSTLEKRVEPQLRELFGERLQVSFFSEMTASEVDYAVDDVLWLIDGPGHFVRDEKGDERRTGGDHLLDALWKSSGLTPIRLSYRQLDPIEEEPQKEVRAKKYKDLLVQTLKDQGRFDLLDPKTKVQSARKISSEPSVPQEQKREIRESQPVARTTDTGSDSRVPRLIWEAFRREKRN